MPSSAIPPLAFLKTISSGARRAGIAASRKLARTPLFIAVSSAIITGAILAVVVAFAIGALVGTEHGGHPPAQLDVYKTALTVVAGVGGAVALVVAYRRQRDLEQGRFVQRFGAAAAQLGDSDVAVRIAGVYAMAGVADESSNFTHRQQCIDVLCGYLRLPYDPEQGYSHRTALVTTTKRQARPPITSIDEEVHLRLRQNDREVRQTIVRVIAAHSRPSSQNRWSDNSFDFSGVLFEDVPFEGVRFAGEETCFDGATFNGGKTSFDNASFDSKNTSFFGTTFNTTFTSFMRATFKGENTSFDSASFHGNVFFSWARFSGKNTSFDGATFSGKYVFFQWVPFDCEKTSFEKATFSSENASFLQATFSGETTFSGATFSGESTLFNEATFSGKTSFAEADVWEDGLPSDRKQGMTFSGKQISFLGVTFSGETTFNRATFRGGRTFFNNGAFSGETTFDGATFSGEHTSFDEATFGGGTTDFNSAWFSGENISFLGVIFSGDRASFEHPQAWNDVRFDWSEDSALLPECVRPRDWPPIVGS